MMKEYKLFREKHDDDDDNMDSFFQMKGWRNDIFLFTNNQFYELSFYTPEVLPKFINSDIERIGMSLLYPYVIIIPEITLQNILKSVGTLVKYQLLNNFKPIEQKDGLIELIINSDEVKSS